eukprot:gi/632957163/ref/XP_007894323.1/ PREDICTED: rho GTPase-activating protein 32 [Callorhinchus milii]
MNTHRLLLYCEMDSIAGAEAGGVADEPVRLQKDSTQPEDNDYVSELLLTLPPRDRLDWEETISAMARSAEVPDLPTDLPLRSCGSTASMKVKNVKKLTFTKGHFPKLAECAHFHYENVDFGSIQLALTEEQNDVTRNGADTKDLVFLVQVSCQGRSWIVKRSYEDFRVLDKHLHLCIYDRRFSQLAELPRTGWLKEPAEIVTQMLMAYLTRLSVIADNKINCGPALTWMEIDNKGNHLLVHEESSINVPAIAAAHVIKRYNAQATDELSFEVGDIVSVIDMPPKEDTTWWRGKHGFQVGFFPSECVELINDKVPHSVTSTMSKPVSPGHGTRPASWSYFSPYLEMESIKPDSSYVSASPLSLFIFSGFRSTVSKKHGKLITFLRTFMKSRPTKQKLKQRGILKERVFGCDLGEHLLNSGHDVPQVLKSCTEFIERHGVVDGIYRLSGIASNIQKLRHEFDSEQIPDLTKDLYLQDIHCVGSLCKLYFRELPNPLLTYQLYEKFSDAVSVASDEDRLIKIHDVIQQLPPPHYRTLEFLMRHLARLATFSYITNMHTKNLAIVWAPNLLRSRQIESACFSGTAAFMEVRIQSVVVEFILNHVDVLFSSKLSSVIREGAGHSSLSRPKSLLVSSPSTKLLTLEEAQARTQAQINSPVTVDSKYIEVGDGPAALQGRFHTIIDFPIDRKRTMIKAKKSPVGTWRSFFNLGKSSSVAKRKLQRNPSEPSEMKAMALGGRGDSGTLRSAKSEESLSSLHNVEGESKLYRPRRPRSSSDALSVSFNVGILPSLNHCNSYDNLPNDESEGEDTILQVPALVSPRMEEVELSPPDMGAAGLDFDPMSFQCSPPRADPEGPDFSTPHVDFFPFISKDRAIGSKREMELGSEHQTPGSGSSSEPVSPSPDKLMSPFFSPDLSPTEDKLAKPTSFAEKMVHAFSPKVGRKSPKSPPLTISEPITISVPMRVSEMIGSMATVSLGTSPSSPKPAVSSNVSKSPPHMISMLLKTSEGQIPESCQQEIHRKLSSAAVGSSSDARGQHPEWYELTNQNKTVSSTPSQSGGKGQSPEGHEPTNQNKASPPAQSQMVKNLRPEWREPTNQNKAVSSTQSQTGTVAESPQEAPAVSAVPLLPPPPPPKSAARLLALALAESAQQQQTSAQPHRKKGNQPPVPPPGPQISVDRSHPPPTPMDRSHPPPTFMERSHPPPSPMDRSPSSPPVTSHHKSAPPPTPPVVSSHHKPVLPPPPPAVTNHHKSAPPPHLPAVSSHHTSAPPTVDPQPATGQAPPSTKVGPTPSGQVRGCTSPVKQPETRVSEPLAPAFTSDITYTSRPATAMAVHSGYQEKARDSAKGPVTHPRAESVPPDHSSYSKTPPTPPLRSMESKIAASHSLVDTITASNFHSFLASTTIPSSIEDALPPAPPAKPPFLYQSHPYHSKGESLPDPDTYYQQKHPHFSQPLVYQCRADSVPQHLSYQCRAESIPQHPAYNSRPENLASASSRFNTFNSSQLKAINLHMPKPRSHSRVDYALAGTTGLRAHGYPHAQFEEAPYPTLRRVHSLHVPPSSIRSVPISRTEVPPEDEIYYYQRPIYQYKAYQPPPPPQSDYHVTQLQPYFENGRVQYRYSPYSPSSSGYSLHATDGTFYDLADPYGSARLRPFHSFTSRDVPQYVGRFHGKSAPYPSVPPPYPRGSAHHTNAVSREHSFVSRDVPPSPDVKLAHIMWDAEDSEKSRFQSIRRETRARQKSKGAVMSQYDNVTPVLQEELGGLEVVHLRSKSDPGKSGLVMSSEGQERWHPGPGKTPDPDQLYAFQRQEGEPDSPAPAYLGSCAHHHHHHHLQHHGVFGNGQLEKPALPQKQSNSRARKGHEQPYDQLHYAAGLQQESSQRQLLDSQTYSAHPVLPPAYGPKHRQEHPDSQAYLSSTGKYLLSSAHEAPRGNYDDQATRSPEERPELERPRVRPSPADKPTRACYSEEEELSRISVPSTRYQQHPDPLPREQTVSYPCPLHLGGPRHSTLTVASQYDNLDDYHAVSQQQRAGVGGSIQFAAPGPGHPARTFGTALGQGSYLPTDLTLQRSEAEVHVE